MLDASTCATAEHMATTSPADTTISLLVLVHHADGQVPFSGFTQLAGHDQTTQFVTCLDR